MELKRADGLGLISGEEVAALHRLAEIALKTRLSIISYSRSKNENNLNACARHCNEMIKLLDSLDFS
jgi:hypothetical protein